MSVQGVLVLTPSQDVLTCEISSEKNPEAALSICPLVKVDDCLNFVLNEEWAAEWTLVQQGDVFLLSMASPCLLKEYQRSHSFCQS